MIRVTHYLRRPGQGFYSLERLYADVRHQLSRDFVVSVCVNRFFSRGIVGRLADALRVLRYQGDVNHVTGDVHYLTYFLSRHRTVLTILDCVSLERARGYRFWILWFFWFWLPVNRSVVIPVISESTRRQLLDYVRCDPSKVRVIYCNVSDEFTPASLRFNSKCPRILHVGTTANKNLNGHVVALAGMPCLLVIIGALNADQRHDLERHGVAYENHVGLSREELLAQYRRCDLVLFASTYEGFGLPIVEAQAVGRPVITSRLWSMPEVAGNGACLVDPYDIESIRSGVQRVIMDATYRESLIQAGFHNVKRFRTEVIAAYYADLYREVYEKARAGRSRLWWRRWLPTQLGLRRERLKKRG